MGTYVNIFGNSGNKKDLLRVNQKNTLLISVSTLFPKKIIIRVSCFHSVSTMFPLVSTCFHKIRVCFHQTTKANLASVVSMFPLFPQKIYTPLEKVIERKVKCN